MTSDRFLDLIPDAVVVWDDYGRISVWNPAAASLYGVPARQAIGALVADVLGPLPKAPSKGTVERLAAGGRRLLIEAVWSRRAGDDGAPETVEIGRDVTAQRAVEERLTRSELRYSSLFQAMAAAFWELDFAPVGDMLRELRGQGIDDFPQYFDEHPAFVREMMRRTRIVDVNETTLALFGIGTREHLEESVEPYWPESSSAVYAAAVKAAISRGGHYMTETRLRRRDGSEFDALFTAAFPHEGLVQGALLVGVIDISDRLAAQADLRRLQDEFAHAARVSMLGELAASIAHEVNQPLAAISTNAAASLRWLSREAPDVEKAVALTSRIGADAQRAADVIARVRGMAAKRAAEREALNLRGLIEETLVFLQDELRSRGARVAVEGDDATVRGDRTQLQQVLVNLVMNAVQAVGSAARIQVRTRASSDAVSIMVSDNGPGFTTDPDSLFDSFYTTKPDGMGLGLPICRSIVEAHGGRITASNAEVGGAVFLIRFPVENDHTKV